MYSATVGDNIPVSVQTKCGRFKPTSTPLYQKYYDISITPERGISIISKQYAITEVEKNYGCFALMSNDIKDPIDALVIYRLKELAEKAFHNLKERLNMRRTSVSSQQNLEGKLFAQFRALICLSYITKQ